MKTITIPLELAERIAERLHEVADPRIDKDLFDEIKPLMEAQAPEYHHIWEGEYYASDDKLKPVKNMTATEVINNTEAYFKNLAESIETKSDFNIWLSKLHDHLLIKAAMGKGDNHG